MRQKLIIFVKAPRPGFVKTRLAEAIGPAAASAAYEALLTTVLERVQALQNVELRFTPDDAVSEIASWLQPSWAAVPQGAGDLGARLSRAFDKAFAAGCMCVTAIGSDCPGITELDIRQSWDLLAQNDAVLGPANDGGYWLIALKAPAHDVFTNIDWSTSRVLEQTIAILARTGRSYHLLRPLRDVDIVEDWKRFTLENPSSTLKGNPEFYP